MLTQIQIPFTPAVLPAYPFLALVGLWAGMWLASREADRQGFDGDHLYNIGLYALVAGLVGGRIAYVAGHWEAYADNIGQALALTANAIAIFPAILCALGAALVYLLRHHLPLPQVADTLALGAALALIIGGLGAFMGSQQLGTITTVPWGLPLFDQVRHPVHLYQALATAIILAILWRVRSGPPWPGFTFLLFIELYAGSRLLLDPFFDSPPILDLGFRTVQLVALIVMVAVLVIMMQVEQSRLPKSTVIKS